MTGPVEKYAKELETCKEKVALLETRLRSWIFLEEDLKLLQNEAEKYRDRHDECPHETRQNLTDALKLHSDFERQYGDSMQIKSEIASWNAKLKDLEAVVTTGAPLHVSSYFCIADVIAVCGKIDMSPSECAISKNFQQVQKERNSPVWMHRPGEESGVPVSLFCPLFADFEKRCATIEVDEDDIQAALALMQSMSEFYEKEADRQKMAIAVLENYLGPIRGETLSVKVDSHFEVAGFADRWATIIIIKNELGGASGCPVIQSTAYYLKYLGERENVSNHMPCFLVVIAGSHMLVFGAVAAYRILIDPLTFVPLYFQVQQPRPLIQLARTLKALKMALFDIKNYHRNVRVPKSQINYPPARPIPPYPPGGTNGHLFPFKYTGPIGLRSLYRVKGNDDTAMILKFTAHYDIKAHYFCAQAGFAPRVLGYAAPGNDGFHTILMDALDDYTIYATEPLNENCAAVDKKRLMDKIEEALGVMHAKNYVHGDCRPTNIMYRKLDDGTFKVMFIDFDFAGEVGVGRYPLTKNPESGGLHHPDAKAGTVLAFEHDFHAFDKMKTHSNGYNVPPLIDAYPKLIAPTRMNADDSWTGKRKAKQHGSSAKRLKESRSSDYIPGNDGLDEKMTRRNGK